MESSLGSWQIENFSSAELFSPPISPSPPSPSLYNGVPVDHLHKISIGAGKVHSASQQSSTSIRAQLASSILNDLEQQELPAMEINDFGMNWNEESVNLNLFEELEEIEYTPPASPRKGKATESSYNTFANSNANLTIRLPQIHHLNNLASESSADISILTAEFQAILDSLPKDSDNTEALSQVLEYAGIPTTIINGEALVPVEFDFTSIQNFDMELDDLNEDSISETGSNVIEESELYAMSDISNQGSPASSVHSSYDALMHEEIEVDHHQEAAEKILDALLIGDVETAENYLPEIVDDDDDDDDDDSSISSEDSYHPSTPVRPRVAEAKKPERRGRKPGKKLAKGSPAYVKDKTIRKKEQNKTAATRYRQKKKVEFSIILENEDELQKEHDELVKTKENLSREILMVKQLLRDVIKAKNPATKLIVQGQGGGGGNVSVSSGITRNRRK